ncbi:MAG: hypothetical protein AAFY63_20140 [Cyanobacteria bacterium J06643_13]
MRKISLENLKITTIAQWLNGDRKLSKSQILSEAQMELLPAGAHLQNLNI